MTAPRKASNMTAQDLKAWRERHGHSLNSGAWWLGISREQFARYLAGTKPVPLSMALHVAAIDLLSTRQLKDYQERIGEMVPEEAA